MVDEWVSVRAMLSEDPKTIAITNWLSAYQPFRDWLGVPVEKINANALVSVTLKGLIKVWAVGNSRGLLDDKDVLLLHADLAWIDRIGQVPGLGKAMDSVHWAVPDRVNGVTAIRLPNFLEYNRPLEDRSEKERESREKNRERQRRFRERHKASNGDVTANNASTASASALVTHRTAQDAAHAGIDRGMQGGKGQDGNSSATNPDPTRAREDVPELELKPQRKFLNTPVPSGFQAILDSIVSTLDLANHTDEFQDQIGFLARLAYADASGFNWPPDRDGRGRILWNLIEQARTAKYRRTDRIRNSAAYLTKVLRDDLGAPAWKAFNAAYPDASHCRWLLSQLYAGAITEGGG